MLICYFIAVLLLKQDDLPSLPLSLKLYPFVVIANCYKVLLVPQQHTSERAVIADEEEA